MSRIAIDITPTQNINKYRGVGKYTANLVSSLKKYDHDNEYIFYSREQNIPNKVDLVHYPYFDLFFLTLPIIKKTKTIITIHDVIPLIFPDKFPKGAKGLIKFEIQRFSLKYVNAVITDSQQSKSDIIKYLGLPDRKIDVVNLAHSNIFKKLNFRMVQKISKKYQLPSDFILYVGDVNYNKNIINLIKAVSGLNVNLVLVGKAFTDNKLNETKAIFELINNLKFKKVKFLGFISESDLNALYGAAKICVQPSIYEGFGLTLIEAMASGSLIVSSDIPPHREIGGNVPIYFDPMRVDDISRSLRKALDLTEKEKDIKISQGIKQAKKFTWEETAKKTVEVYKKVLSK